MTPVLITAGATRNRVDAIRYLSAHATGKTGVYLAESLAAVRGVHLLGSAEAVLRAELACCRGAAPFTTEAYLGTLDLLERMERWLRANPLGTILHSAAVGDYLVEETASKIPSGQPEVTLKLRPGPKIVDHIRGWAPACRLVSFKAGAPEWDVETLATVATAQLRRTGSDRVFANIIGRTGEDVLLVSSGGWTRYGKRDEGIAALLAWVREG